MALEVGELYARLNLDTGKFDSELNSAEGKFNSFGHKISASAVAMGSAVASAMKDVAMIGGAAIIGAATLGTKSFADYEQGLANVKKTAGFTADEVKAFGEQLRDLSKTSGIKVTALEEIAATGGSIGIAKESMLDFTKAVAIGTKALGLSQEELATSSGKWMANFGVQGNELINALSAVNELENTTAAKSSQLVSGFEQIASIAPKMGMGFNQANAYLATQVTYLGDVEKAATGLDSAYNQVLQNEKNIGEAAKLLGVDTGTFIDMMKKDGLTTMHNLYQSIDQAYTKEEAVIAKQRLFGTYGQRAMTAINQGWQDYTKNLQASNAAFKDGTGVMNEFQIQTNTVWGSIDKLKAGLNDVGIEIGQNIAPSLSKVVSYLTDKFVPAAKEAVQALFQGDWGKLGGIVKEGFNDALNALKGLNWSGLLDGLSSALGQVGAYLSTIDWSAMTTSLMGALAGLADMVKEAMSKVDWGAVGKEAVEVIQAAFAGLPGVLAPIGSAAASALSGVLSGALSTIKGQMMSVDFASVGSMIGTTIGNGLRTVAGWAEVISEKIRSVDWSGIGSGGGAALGSAIVNALKNALAALPDVAKAAISLMGSVLAAGVDLMAGSLSTALNSVMSTVSSAVQRAFEASYNAMLDKYNYLGQKLYGVVGKTWQDVSVPDWAKTPAMSTPIEYKGELGAAVASAFDRLAGAAHNASAGLEGLADASKTGGLIAPEATNENRLPPVSNQGIYDKTLNKYVSMEQYLGKLVAQGYDKEEILAHLGDYKVNLDKWMDKNPNYREDLTFGAPNQLHDLPGQVAEAFNVHADKTIGMALYKAGDNFGKQFDETAKGWTTYVGKGGQIFYQYGNQTGVHLSSALITSGNNFSTSVKTGGVNLTNVMNGLAGQQVAMSDYNLARQQAGSAYLENALKASGTTTINAADFATQIFKEGVSTSTQQFSDHYNKMGEKTVVMGNGLCMSGEACGNSIVGAGAAFVSQINQASVNFAGTVSGLSIGGYRGGGGGGINTWSSQNPYPSTAYVKDSIFTSSGGMFDNSTCEIDDLSGMSPGLIESLAASGVWKPNSGAASQAIAANIGYTGYDASGRYYQNGKYTGGSTTSYAPSTPQSSYSNVGSYKPAGTTTISGSAWGSMYLSKGGLVTKPGLAMIGEKGPELVLNAIQTRNFMAGMHGRRMQRPEVSIPDIGNLEGMRSGMSIFQQQSNNVPIIMQMDGRTIGHLVGRRMVNDLQTMGVKVK